jgi:hypothetical protein
MKKAAILALLLAVGVGATWAATGMHFASRTKKPVETKAVDEFGDEEITTEWVDTFELGLDYGGPAGGGLIGLAGLLFFLDRRKNKA